MKNITTTFCIALAIAITGCATTAQRDSRGIEPKQIGAVGLGQKRGACAVAYDYGGQLLIVQRTDQLEKENFITLYNPKNGLFGYLRAGKNKSCENVDVFARGFGNGLYAFNAPSEKNLFDSALTTPDPLLKFLNTEPPHFNDRGMTGETRFKTKVYDYINFKGLEKLSDFLRDVSPKEASEWADGVRKSDADKQAARDAENNRVKALNQEAQKRWTDRGKNTYRTGDMVCTAKGNHFGNVEAVEAGRIKVYVIGSARWADAYFFSYVPYKDFSYDTVEAQRWFSLDEVGPCHFNNLRQGR